RWDDGTGTKLVPQRAEVAGTVDIGPEMADLPAVDPETGEIEREGDELDPLAGHGGHTIRGRQHSAHSRLPGACPPVPGHAALPARGQRRFGGPFPEASASPR